MAWKETLSVLLTICDGNPPVIDRFPSQRAINADFWFFLYSRPEQIFEQAVELPVIWHAITKFCSWANDPLQLDSRGIVDRSVIPPVIYRGLAQDCGNSTADALELPESRTAIDIMNIQTNV